MNEFATIKGLTGDYIESVPQIKKPKIHGFKTYSASDAYEKMHAIIIQFDPLMDAMNIKWDMQPWNDEYGLEIIFSMQLINTKHICWKGIKYNHLIHREDIREIGKEIKYNTILEISKIEALTPLLLQCEINELLMSMIKNSFIGLIKQPIRGFE